MRIDEALNIKVGDRLHNIFLDQVVVTGIVKSIDSIYFNTVDSKLYTCLYLFEHLYDLDLIDVCDEEKSFIYWSIKNREFLEENFYSISMLKKAYMNGFSDGFEAKRKYTAEENLQK